MFIEVYKNNSIPWIRVCKSVMRPNKNGVLVSNRKVIANIGALSRFDGGDPDFINKLRESCNAGKPLIAELEPYFGQEAKKQKPEGYTLFFEKSADDCIGYPKYCGNIILDGIFNDLKLPALFATLKHSRRFQFDAAGLVKLLTYGRIIEPCSKKATFEMKDDFFPEVTDEDTMNTVYDALELLHDEKDKIIKRLDTAIDKGWGRRRELIYYDITNFFFEIDYPDPDNINEDGTETKGLRKKGVSKESRKSPIVQVGLFVDNEGIPITYEIFPGNTLDHQTVKSSLEKNVSVLGCQRFVMISDRGVFININAYRIMKEGNGFIMAKSIKKSDKDEKQWIVDDNGYTWLGSSGNFKYKSHTVKKVVTDDDGTKHEIEYRVVAYWSRAFYERDKHNHKTFMEFLEKFRANPDSFRFNKTMTNKLKYYLTNDVINTETGEVLNAKKLLAILDEEKLCEKCEYMGYYQIATSEMDLSDLEVIDKYHGLTLIEDEFHVQKSDLDARPMFVRTPEHIDGHIMVLFISLLMIRLIQKKLIKSGVYDNRKEFLKAHPKVKFGYRPETQEPYGTDEDDLHCFEPIKGHWCYGMSSHRVIAALKRFSVEHIANGYYRFNNYDDPDLDMLLKAFGVDLEKKLYMKKELREMKKEFNLFNVRK